LLYVKITKEQMEKAAEARRGKPIFSEPMPKEENKGEGIPETAISPNGFQIQSPPQLNFATPFLPVLDIGGRVFSYWHGLMQRGEKALTTGNWGELFTPSQTMTETAKDVLENPVGNFLVNVGATIFLFKGTNLVGGVAKPLIEPVTARFASTAAGRMVISAMEKVADSALGKKIGSSLYSGVEIPGVSKVIGKITIPFKDIAIFTAADIGVDTMARTLSGKQVDLPKTSTESLEKQAMFFMLFPPALHTLGFTLLQTGKGVAWGIDKSLQGVLKDYYDVMKERVAKSIAPISSKLIDTTAEHLLKSDYGERMKSVFTINTKFPKLLKDPDFQFLVKEKAKELDRIRAITEGDLIRDGIRPGGALFSIRIGEILLNEDKNKMVRELSVNPIAHSTLENLMKRYVGITSDIIHHYGHDIEYRYFDTEATRKAADSLLRKYKDLFDLKTGKLAGYWRKSVEEHMGMSPDLPAEFYEELTKNHINEALSYVKNLSARALLQKVIDQYIDPATMKIKENQKDILINHVTTFYKYLYDNLVKQEQYYLTRVGWKSLKEVKPGEQQMDKTYMKAEEALMQHQDENGMFATKEVEQPQNVENVMWESEVLNEYKDILANIDMKQIKERLYPTSEERILNDLTVTYKNGWDLRRSFAASVLGGVRLYDLGNLIKRLDKGAQDTFTIAKTEVSPDSDWFEYYAEKGERLKDGIYAVSDLKTTKNIGASTILDTEAKLVYYPTVMFERDFLRNGYDKLYEYAAGENIYNHYNKINFGTGTYLIDKYYADFLGRFIPLTEGNAMQLLAPNLATKIAATMKAIELSSSVIHFPALASAALGIKHGKLALGVLGDLIKNSTFQKDLDEFYEQRMSGILKVYTDFMNKNPNIVKNKDILSAMDVPMGRGQFGYLQEMVNFLNDSGIKDAMSKVPGVGAAMKPATRVLKGITVDLEDLLWNKYVPLLKGTIVKEIIEKGEREGLHPQEIYNQITRVKDALGGQSIWYTLSPNANSIIRLVAFAPDWYVTLTKHVTRMLDGTPEFATFIPRVLSLSSTIANALSIAFTGEGIFERFTKTHDLRDLGRFPIPVLIKSPNGTLERKIIHIDLFGYQAEGLEFLGILPLMDSLIKYSTTIQSKPLEALKIAVTEAFNDWGKFIMSKSGIGIQILKGSGEHVRDNPVSAIIGGVLSRYVPIFVSSLFRLFPYVVDKDPNMDTMKKTELWLLSMFGARIRTATNLSEEGLKIWLTNTTFDQKVNGEIPAALQEFFKKNKDAFASFGYPEKKSFEKTMIEDYYAKYIKLIYGIDVNALSSNKALREQVLQKAQQDDTLKKFLQHAKPSLFRKGVRHGWF